MSTTTDPAEAHVAPVGQAEDEEVRQPRRRLFAAMLGMAAGAAGAVMLRPGGTPTAEANHGANNFSSNGNAPTVHVENSGNGQALQVDKRSGDGDAVFVHNQASSPHASLRVHRDNGSGSAVSVRRASFQQGHAIEAFDRSSSDGSHVVFALKSEQDADVPVGQGHAVLAVNHTAAADSHGVSAERSGGHGHALLAVREGSATDPRGGRFFDHAVLAQRNGEGPGDGVQAQRSGGGNGDGVQAERNGGGNGHGVSGQRNGLGSGDGVRGERGRGGGDGHGVHGVRAADGVGAGVLGRAFGGGNTGVIARAETGADALRVEGRSRFSTVGEGTINANTDSQFVPNTSVTAKSHITVTLTSNPGDLAVSVGWVERLAGGFTVHLTKRLPASTTFTYFIVEPL